MENYVVHAHFQDGIGKLWLVHRPDLMICVPKVLKQRRVIAAAAAATATRIQASAAAAATPREQACVQCREGITRRFSLHHIPGGRVLQKAPLCLNSPCVCPEPVLVKSSFSERQNCIAKKGVRFPHWADCLPGHERGGVFKRHLGAMAAAIDRWQCGPALSIVEREPDLTEHQLDVDPQQHLNHRRVADRTSSSCCCSCCCCSSSCCWLFGSSFSLSFARISQRRRRRCHRGSSGQGHGVEQVQRVLPCCDVEYTRGVVADEADCDPLTGVELPTRVETQRTHCLLSFSCFFQSARETDRLPRQARGRDREKLKGRRGKRKCVPHRAIRPAAAPGLPHKVPPPPPAAPSSSSSSCSRLLFGG